MYGSLFSNDTDSVRSTAENITDSLDFCETRETQLRLKLMESARTFFPLIFNRAWTHMHKDVFELVLDLQLRSLLEQKHTVDTLRQSSLLSHGASIEPQIQIVPSLTHLKAQQRGVSSDLPEF